MQTFMSNRKGAVIHIEDMKLHAHPVSEGARRTRP
jgi:hypothetical protein